MANKGPQTSITYPRQTTKPGRHSGRPRTSRHGDSDHARTGTDQPSVERYAQAKIEAIFLGLKTESLQLPKPLQQRLSNNVRVVAHQAKPLNRLEKQAKFSTLVRCVGYLSGDETNSRIAYLSKPSPERLLYCLWLLNAGPKKIIHT